MCKFADFETFPEEFHRKLKRHLKSIIDHDLYITDKIIAKQLLEELKVIELKMRDAYFGAGTRRKVMSILTTTQVLAVHRAVVVVLRESTLVSDLSYQEYQDLATEIVIALDKVIS